MSFDKPTRNRLAKFVADARELLAGIPWKTPPVIGELGKQMAEIYGISANGEIAPLDKLGHLDEAGLATAALLRERIEYLEKTHPDDKDGTKAAVARLAREQAFTILNRLAAIRMAEKRGLIVESVGKGYQSRGFKVYETIAGSALGDAYHRYRRFLFCLFDELAIDLGILFDRRSPQALLFPREPALLALLDLLNGGDLEPLWAEDETIGWIYQYYNDPEERKKMRAESPAPRNSRELAVRNQFFTPRYVVEFLTDNTLGRIWYEMTQGQTRLKDQCRYLVRRPFEFFLSGSDGSDFPEHWSGRQEMADFWHSGDISKLPENPHTGVAIEWMITMAGVMGFEHLLPLLDTDHQSVMDQVLVPAEKGESAHLNDVHPLVLMHCLWRIGVSVARGGGYGEEDRPIRSDDFGGARHLWEALYRKLTEPQERQSQEDLLRHPIFIPHRTLKDPREIRLLDPACGSMHFGLYAFDLFETIYEEAWDLAETHSHPDLRSLTSDFSSKEAFLREVPRLIIEHNIHGIDIDPRAVQIAGLSLWLRAQKAWQARGVKPADRPRVRRSNIVCAEPMPGSPEMLEEFVATLDPPLLGELVKTVFDKMQLAGEAGSLLKIDEEIRTAIDTARKEWLQQQDDLLTRKDGSQEEFFNTAEQQVIDALRAYAEQADADSYQRRLFADDAARGFAFIDLCHKCYDAVVMNPPFGSFSKLWTAQSKIAYPDSANDILGAFVERFLHRLHGKGRLGAITSRTCFFLTTFNDWRRNVVLKESAVRAIADLGQGVMDDAMVEAAAYVLESTLPTSSMTVFRAIADADRQRALEACLDAHQAGKPESRLFLAHQQTFDLLPDAPFVYWINDETIRQFKTGSSFEPDVGLVRVGLQTGDDLRYVRATWEVGFEDTIFCYYPSNGDAFCSFDDPIVQAYFKRREKGTPQWAFHVKSGASQPWYSPITLKLNYAQDGAELRNFKNDKGKLKSALRSTIMYHRPGFSWTRRAVRFYPYVIPSNCIPSVSRYMAFPDHGMQAEALAVCASRLASAFLRFYGEKFEFPNFLVDTLKALPWPELPDEAKAHFEKLISREVEQRRLAYQNHEPFHEFLLPGKIRDFSNDGQSLAFDAESLLDAETEKMIADAFGFTEEQTRAVERDLLEAISYQQVGGASDEVEDVEDAEAEEEGKDADSDFVLDYSKAALEEANLSYLVGTAFGRWDIRYATGERQPPELPDPFDPLPVCPPGMLQNAEGLPAEPKDVPADYPLRLSWPGILVDDENHLNKDGKSDDIVARVEDALKVIWKDRWEAIEQEACDILGVKTLRDYFRRPAAFFADHLKRYSKSRRQAPIYWPLSTKSGSYTLWLYYHRLTDQTLHTCLADFLDPKIKKVQSELDALVASGKDSTRAGELREFLDELKDLRDEIERVIKLPWKPNLNDGVLITASPLHKLFRLPKWQKDLKACWDKLAKGDYDWAHLAYTIWPTRVEKACEKDRSIAIAHNREDLCKVEAPKPKKKRAKKKGAEVEDEDELELMEED